MVILDRNTLAELVELLTPLMRDEQQRRALLAQALIGSAILDSIDYSGSTNGFITRVVERLAEFGEIEPGKSALWALLEVCREHMGIDIRQRIDALQDVANSIRKLAGAQVEGKVQNPLNEYSEIEFLVAIATTLAQASMLILAIGVLANLINTEDWKCCYFSPFIFLVITCLIIAMFWLRFYHDTRRVNRAYKIYVVVLFALFLIVQDISIYSVTSPQSWLVSMGLLFIFGALFYDYNLREMHVRKQCVEHPEWEEYKRWQFNRRTELIVLTFVAFINAYLVRQYPSLAFPQAIIAISVAIWQLYVTRKNIKFFQEE